MEEQEEVYIWWFMYYLKVFLDIIPSRVSVFLMKHLICQGMKTFVGRDAPKKNY